ncbi:extracellular solute-binding protein [Streptococcus sp. zg-JUN1979]|uniref:extracellular solute-binding protein n=1 Tax=Streptococcus sp. zg-JUN1979 TaxID=3391450 RepID=UPI0039A5055E
MAKKTWKKWLAASAALTLAAGLVSVASIQQPAHAASKTTVKLWVPTDSKDSYTDIIKNFEKENSGIKVKVIESNGSKAQENVKKDPSKAADVFSLPHDQLGLLVESGIIQEIPSDYAKEIKENDTEQAVLGAQYKGKTYAFPTGIESQVLFYNKEKLSAEDVTSYESITTKATFGANLKQVNAYAMAPLFFSVGDTLFGKDGENPKGTNWGNEAGVSVLQWIADQKDNKGFVNINDDNMMSKFSDGSIAAMETGPWNFAAAQKAIGADKLGVAVYPTISIGGKDVQQQAFLGVQLYAVNQAPAGSDTKRIAASYKLASYITSAESQKQQFESRHIVPANKEVQASETVQANELAQAVITMGSSDTYTTVMPKLSQMSTFWEESAAILSDAYSGKIKSSDYLKRLKQFDSDLAKAK